MGWNGSGGSADKSTKKASAKKKAGGLALKRAALGGLVVVVGALATFMFLSDSAEPVAKKTKAPAKKTIAEAPVKAKKTKAPAPKAKKIEAPKKVVDHPPTNKWGNPWHWGPNKKLKPKHISRFDRSKLPLYEQIFKNSADRTIAGLLVIEPGDDLIGSDEPSPWFMKSFLKSLKTPVVPTKDDSEEAAALKRAVNETKIELKARMDAGEDIVKILTETRRELRELGAYREELKKLVDDFRRKNAVTSADLEDMVGAANKMLEERGLKKIVMPEFYYKQIEMRTKIRKAKEEKNAQ
jgi:hypothetical protein